MYTSQNFPSKAALKRHLADPEATPIRILPNEYHQIPANDPTYTGTVSLEGPWYPKPHSWWGTGTVVDGVLVSVK